MNQNFHPLLIVLLAFNSSCSSSKLTTESTATKSETSESIELVINEFPEYYIWEKGSTLHLSGKITNRSNKPITILEPKSKQNYTPDFFQVKKTDGFTGNACIYPANDNIYRSSKDFLTILPNESKEIHINGNNYFLNYCNENGIDSSEITIQLVYNFYERKSIYDEKSYFITTHYKTELSEEEKKHLQFKLNKRAKQLEKIDKEKREKILKDFEKTLVDRKIKSTPEEQKIIIKKYNSLYPHKISSNIIKLRIK